jgi:hypothetical protein
MRISRRGALALELGVAVLLAVSAIAAVVAIVKTSAGAWWWIAVGALALAVAIPGCMSLERVEDSGREVRAELRVRFGRWYYVLLPLMAVGLLFVVPVRGVQYVVGMFGAFFKGLRGETV